MQLEGYKTATMCLPVISTEALEPISLWVSRYDLPAHRRRVITSLSINEYMFL